MVRWDGGGWRESREGELEQWRGKHKARPVSNDVISLVSQRVNKYGLSQTFQVGPVGLSLSFSLSSLLMPSLSFCFLWALRAAGERGGGPSGDIAID